MMTLAQAAAWMAQTLPQVQYGSAAAAEGANQITLQRVHTDSRSVQPGDLFIALRGERLDAHDFLAQAQAAGAAAAVVELGRSLPGLPCLEVSDTTAALGALAAGWRSQFGLPLVAVTGSNGKTTVTQMLASILTAAAGEAAFATRGNFNNAIGVPLTLLRLTAQHRLGVVELGMNHPGEIADLACIAQPTIALVNNAQREHQEFMHTAACWPCCRWMARPCSRRTMPLPPCGKAWPLGARCSPLALAWAMCKRRTPCGRATIGR